MPSPTQTSMPIQGVHHTARPTWKLRETVEFYRDRLGLPLVHAISARGWPEGHPDFLHFFFDAGKGATIAFFYYIGTERPEHMEPNRSTFYDATHTAWSVEKAEDLQVWRDHLRAQGVELFYEEVEHEIIKSLYFMDPNGYMIEFAYQLRPMVPLDAEDAQRTLRAAMELEDLRDPAKFSCIDDVWRRKGAELAALEGQP
ncbi:VOC family protein [Ramlibacter sp. WS9]|uniref:VOC family protein n=1 Tax=Ramlibacter sp. WS9 TaxID=1882741 RepID=UPI003511282A